MSDSLAGPSSNPPQKPCPFCVIEDHQVVASNRLALAFRDRFPVGEGHTLIIPRRHTPTWFDATRDEQASIMELVDLVKADLDRRLHPSGYNIGVNVGESAGQTVMHLHVHLIPRFPHDVDDPTGGVRYVIPDRANYRRPGHIARVPGSPESEARRLAAGGRGDPFIAHLAPLFGKAEKIEILAAFVQDSGVRHVEPYLLSALGRGAEIRILAGDYFNLTQARALRRLLDLVRGVAAGALGRDDDDPEPDAATTQGQGLLEVRVVEVERIRDVGTSFHPKAWIFQTQAGGSAFVGSSNLTQTALTDGIEWNLRIDRAQDQAGFERIRGAFDKLWALGQNLREEWLEAYSDRARSEGLPPPTGEVDWQPVPVPQPRDIQIEALAALRQDRVEDARRRGLVVMATGLGKTWLAAFDIAQFLQEQSDGCGRPRILILAHRVEILRQAADTLRRLFPDWSFGYLAGAHADTHCSVVLASVQKLSRKHTLHALAPHAFDYIVVDEVHHADAATYRRILNHLDPAFLLGLTATPERADAGDILGLFDDHIAFRADVGMGIELGHLVPFTYYGLKDVVDYAPIPWRNRRFDPEALSRAVQTHARMERLWEAWQAHAAARTLVFCCSIAHARFVADWLTDRGVHCVAVHSGPGSYDRVQALDQLQHGEIAAIATVDIFNEGVDVPHVDRVVMLRPTESPVVFIQQLGRGLRTASGKTALCVIDFVGNHRVFLDRIRTLLQLAEVGRRNMSRILSEFRRDDPLTLPSGCSIDIELEAVDLLERLLSPAKGQQFLRAYREIRQSRGERPTLGEMFRLGHNPGVLRSRGGWWPFLAQETDLDPDEAAALEDPEIRAWLEAIESREVMNKSFKMVVLAVLLDEDSLHTGMEVGALSARCHAMLTRSPELFADLSAKELEDPRHPDPQAWTQYWLRWPLTRWAGEGRQEDKRAWFTISGDRFLPAFAVPESAREAVSRMTRELVDYRLARYRHKKQRARVHGDGFLAHVMLRDGDPILKLPDRDDATSIPEGDTDVQLPDERIWRFRFRRNTCAEAHPVGTARNRLPDLLRGWFGPAAGRAPRLFSVRFTPGARGWSCEPIETEAVPVLHPPAPGRLWAFPSMQAAAGWRTSSDGSGQATASTVPANRPAITHPDMVPQEVSLPGSFDRESTFAVRASGRSMDAPPAGIRDGDWLVMEWARHRSLAELAGRVVLVARTGSAPEAPTFHLKRITLAPEEAEQVADRHQARPTSVKPSAILLASDNPEVTPSLAQPGDIPVAILLKAVQPESLGPAPNTVLALDGIPAAFGLKGTVRPPASRLEGHLFVLESAARSEPGSTSPAETAFLFDAGEQADHWIYRGVARWNEADRRWIPQTTR